MIEEKTTCARCKKNTATVVFTDSVLSWSHGFVENICEECYNKQMKESDWYKQGMKNIIEDEIKFLDSLRDTDILKIELAIHEKIMSLKLQLNNINIGYETDEPRRL